MSDDLNKARDALAEFGLGPAQLSPLGNGLINQTWLVETDTSDEFVLQRVNPIFAPTVNRDIDVLTRHIADKGLATCRIVPTPEGELWVEKDGRVWRLLSRVNGVSHNALNSAAQAREAGAILGKFHRAVSDLEHEFTNRRLGIHDTARHLRFLDETLQKRTDHAEYSQVARLGREILDISRTLPELPEVPDRVVHGDPKVNNILFEPGGHRAVCLVDLDTIARMPLPLELGDAMRSWCNPSGEDYWTGEFSANLFMPAIEGYAEQTRGWISSDEYSSIVPATHVILVELAARFCADALNESYFAWDPDKFATRSEHNQVRAAGQLTEARSLRSQEKELREFVQSAFRARRAQ